MKTNITSVPDHSDLVLHCLPMSHKKDARLIWVNAYWAILDHILIVRLVSHCTAK